jgi:RND family efflux transporter MFP subunit
MRNGIIAVLVVLLAGAGPVVAQGADVLAPLTCLLSPARSSEIGSDHIGLVSRVAVRRADRVKAGQVLVELDAAAMQAQIALDQVSVDGLRAKLVRSAVLVERKLIAAEEVEQLRTDLRMAEATLARSRVGLDQTRVVAPFDGVVADVMVTEGELTGSESLIRLVETRQLRAEMVFVDGAFGKVAVGQAVQLSLDLIGVTVAAEVTAIDPFLDPASNTFLVSALVENTNGDIPAGIGCRVSGWGG